eukprot:1435156-Prymnesium_polylepis.1
MALSVGESDPDKRRRVDLFRNGFTPETERRRTIDSETVSKRARNGSGGARFGSETCSGTRFFRIHFDTLRDVRPGPPEARGTTQTMGRGRQNHLKGTDVLVRDTGCTFRRRVFALIASAP